MLNKTFWRIALIPSVYGIAAWAALLPILSLQIINVKVSSYAYTIYLYTLLCLVLSTYISHRFVKGIVVQRLSERIRHVAIDKWILSSLAAIGSYGMYRYISDFSQLLDGEGFFLTFFISPLRIRELANEETSIGFQLSYFTWPIISYFILLLRDSSRSRLKNFGLFAGIFLCFFANTLFIDRTRPVLLLITAALTYLIIFNKKIRNPVKVVSITLAGPIVIFFGQAFFTKKYDAEEGLISNFLVYLLGGFGYFSAALDDQVQAFNLANTFMPVYKVLAAIGLTAQPPSAILEFKSVPFLTNVGTFLQPLLADGGWLLVLLLLPPLVFILDYIALHALKSNTLFGVFLWSNIVAANLLSFFTPKYNATYLYLFFIMYGLVIMLKIFNERKNLFKPKNK